MKIRILYFAVLRERVGQSTQELDVTPRTTAAQLLQRLRNEHGESTFASVRVACNEEFVSDTHVLHDGDIVALIPPVSGG